MTAVCQHGIRQPWECKDCLYETHTPSPWALRGYQIRADNGRGAHVATYQISEADGRLIAAAPDLYAALKEAVEQLDYAHENWHPRNDPDHEPRSDEPCTCTRARAALAKAVAR